MDDVFSVSIPVVAFALFFIAVMALVLFLSYRQRQVMIEKWDQLAMHTGLTLERGSWLVKPRVHGEYRRHSLELTTYTRSHGKHSTTYTLITLYLPNNSRMLSISSSGMLTEAIGKAFGMQDVQIGNEAFDKRFTIKSQPPEFAVELLGGDLILCDSIAQLKSGWFELRVEGSQMTYREVGRETNPERLEAMFNTLTDLAAKIDGQDKGSF